MLDVNKRSPLHWACAHGNLDQVKIISKLGADIGIIDVEGKTALHFAATSSSSQPGKLLSALVNMKTRGSSSVLCWQDYDGRQPLHLAVTSANPDMVTAIIKHFGDLRVCPMADNCYDTFGVWNSKPHVVNIQLTSTCSVEASHHEEETHPAFIPVLSLSAVDITCE